jgi:hypothetical protein
MMRLRAALAAACGIVLCAGVAVAQPADEAKKKPAPPPPPAEGEGQEVEPAEDDTPPEDIEGTSENPGAPRLPGEENQTVVVVAPPVVRTGYPIEEVLRPITLPAVTSEVGLDAHTRFDPFDLELGLRARYGITRQWQIGLRYLIGGVYDDPTSMDEATAFNTGKAFGIDVTYLVFDWLAAHVTLPMYVDPFAMGMTVGAPMKFRFKDKVALVLLDDLIDVRFTKFVPSLVNEQQNEANRASYEVNGITSDGNINLKFGAIYQQKPNMAFRFNFFQSFVDFGDDDNPTGIEGIVQYSPSADMDVSGRVGIDALDQADSTFGVILAAAYRI